MTAIYKRISELLRQRAD